MFCHHFHHGAEIGDGAVVEIRTGFFDVPEARHLKKVFLGLVFGGFVAAFVLEIRPRFDETKFLEERAAHGGAYVALDTPGLDELLESQLLLGGKSVVVAREKFVAMLS